MKSSQAREIDYSFQLMFEERSISVKAYNLNTILAEKVESILVRNVANTRARDYYDVYILLTLRKNEIDLVSLRSAIRRKAEERNTLVFVDNFEKYVSDIEDSEDLKAIWKSYAERFTYAESISFVEITKIIRKIFEA